MLLQLLPLVLAVSALAQEMDSGYVIPPPDGKWIEAETVATGQGKPQADAPACFGKGYVGQADDKYHASVKIPWSGPGTQHVWARVRGRGIMMKRPGEKDLWRWPQCEVWQWVKLGSFDGKALAPAVFLAGNTAIDCVVFTADASWQPLEMPDHMPALGIRFDRPGKPVPDRLVGANVNSPAAMLIDREDWHAAVRSLGIGTMRFQVPHKGLDYRERETWNDATFEPLDRAVEAARTRWGAKDLLFGVHRLALPMRDGKLLEEEYAAYADGVARLVQRYASPGKVRVRYWEPFNELDHANFLRKLKPHGQDYRQVAKLYAVCSRAIKAVNPDVKVGGPAAMWPGGWETKVMLEEPGMVADFVSWHQYAGGTAKTPDERLLDSIHREKGLVDGLHRIQNAVQDARHTAPLEYLLTEFHINDRIWSPPDNRAATALSAVFAASALINLGQEGVDVAMIHDVLARSYGLVGPISKDGWSRQLGMVPKSTASDPIHMRPAGWVCRWFNESLKGRWVPCKWISTPKGWADSPRRPVVEAAAVVSGADGIVVLINRDTKQQPMLLTGLTDTRPATGFADFIVELRVIDDNGPRIEHVPGPAANGQWRCRLSPMSVTMVRFPQEVLE